MTVSVGPLAVPAPTLAVVVALALDAISAEPPRSVHPVALFGRLVARFDREYDRPGVAGAVIAAALPFLFALALAVPAALALAVHPLAGAVVGGLALFVTLSLRMLLAEGRSVIELTETDPAEARQAIRALVGRDADDLSSPELRSGAVESLAENLADGLVAPLGAFLLGALVSLPVAVGCAAWVKGVNTLDSMLGYRSKPVGRVSARLDDAVMWLPARASALLLGLAARDPGALSRARAWTRTPASPNSGWPMATLAAALGVRLEKPGAYTLNPDEQRPTVEQALRGVRIVALAGGLAGLATVALTWASAGILSEVTDVPSWASKWKLSAFVLGVGR